MKETQSPRYILSSPEPGHYEVKDNRTGVFVTFEENKFNETQQWYHPVDTDLNPVKLNRVCDGLEGWLTWHHRELMGPADNFYIQLSEDGRTVTVVRPGTPGKVSDPHMEITFPAELYQKTAAALVSGMARFIKERAEDWHTRNF